MGYYGYNLLIGVTVEKWELSDDKYSIRIHGKKDGKPVSFVLSTEADCCSHTWIESIMEPDSLVGYTINKVESLELPTPEGFVEDYETTQFYGFVIQTERGRFTVDFRNTSNGYYGGSIRVEERIIA